MIPGPEDDILKFHFAVFWPARRGWGIIDFRCGFLRDGTLVTILKYPLDRVHVILSGYSEYNQERR
jgi:hypothetical protein